MVFCDGDDAMAMETTFGFRQAASVGRIGHFEIQFTDLLPGELKGWWSRDNCLPDVSINFWSISHQKSAWI